MARKNQKKQKDIQNRISIVIIVILILILIIINVVASNTKDNTESLSGNNSPVSSNNFQTASIATVEGDSQIVEINVLPGSYTPIIVQKDIPVKFNLKAESSNLTGCNNGIKIREYGIAIDLKEGDNIVKFTPNKTGTFTYTCWMGMLTSTITVVDDLNNIDSDTINSINETQKANAGATCGGSGGCGCGGGGR